MSVLPWSLLPDSAALDSSGALTVGGCSTVELAERYGTPLFVYDEAHLRARCRETVAAFGDDATYAGKAFLCLAMARLVHEEGLRIDVASEGELFVATQAGVPGDRLVLHGNNKSIGELEAAAEAGVGRVVVDSFDEIDRITEVFARTGHRFDVLLRVTPGVEAHTHHYVATGQDDSKFGFTLSNGTATLAVSSIRANPAMNLLGVHVHIGSQVFLVSSFAAALGAVAEFVKVHRMKELSMGGGLGVAYITGERAPSITEYAGVLKQAAKEQGLSVRLSAEPGRAIAAQAALTIYTVGTVKSVPARTYLAVDGGMSDNPRPVLYGSGYEAFLLRSPTADRRLRVRIVGKHCESGDVLIRDAQVPEDLSVGDFLATPVTGAYGHSMGSTYNKVPRPPVVFVADGKARVVVERESLEDLIRLDRP